MSSVLEEKILYKIEELEKLKTDRLEGGNHYMWSNKREKHYLDILKEIIE
jgi:hypothetical protein